MNRVKKTASLCNKSSGVLIWRKKEDVYWVSNKYFAKKFSRKDFLTFKTKYSNYKGNPYIKDLEIEESLTIRDGGVSDGAPDLDAVIATDNPLVKTECSELLTEEGHAIYYTDDKIVLVRHEYAELFGGWFMTEEEDNKPLYILKQKDDFDTVTGLIMPLRANSYPEVLESIKELSKVLL